MEHFVPYLILAINTIVFQIARFLVNKISPSITRCLLTELIATLELCADCAELGVAWELHGNLGYGLALFLCCMWWCFHWDDAEACPNGPLEDCFLLGTSITSWPVLSKLVGQTIAAILTWSYIQSIWSLHLIPLHKSLNMEPCVAGLQCSMLYGALIEAFITFVSRVVALESGYWPLNMSAIANSITTVALCIFALDSSGGFFNPILASALTLNCSGNNLIQHIFVYWLASFAGSVLARTLHMIIRGVPKDKED